MMQKEKAQEWLRASFDTRYPGELGYLPEGKPNIKDVEDFYNLAKFFLPIYKPEKFKTVNLYSL